MTSKIVYRRARMPLLRRGAEARDSHHELLSRVVSLLIHDLDETHTLLLSTRGRLFKLEDAFDDAFSGGP